MVKTASLSEQRKEKRKDKIRDEEVDISFSCFILEQTNLRLWPFMEGRLGVYIHT